MINYSHVILINVERYIGLIFLLTNYSHVVLINVKKNLIVCIYFYLYTLGFFLKKEKNISGMSRIHRGEVI